jgi:hypothetical protein
MAASMLAKLNAHAALWSETKPNSNKLKSAAAVKTAGV